MASLSRKEFLRMLAMAASAVLTGRYLAACEAAAPKTTTSLPAASSPAHSPTATPAPTNAPASPTNPPAAITATAVQRSDLMKFFPAAPSRVVHMHHKGVWEGETIQQAALPQMLDAAICRLTGLSDALTAWQILFDPGEKVAIKVNCLQYGRYWTHPQLVMAVAARLQAAGVPAGHIIIYDRSSSDLSEAGFIINKDGPGVRCFGTDGLYEPGWEIMDSRVRLSSILLQCDALIDMPILKTHSMDGAGMSFALKNHYGSFDQPQNFHNERLLQGLPALNALAPIRERTRLIIGDALKIVRDNWYSAFESDFISMAFDPVAHDTLGLQALNAAQEASGIDPTSTRQRASIWLQNAADLGLGTNQMEHITFLEERFV